MIEWLSLSPEIQKQVLAETGVATGLQQNAIEKDWWVTLALKACFLTQWKGNLVFRRNFPKQGLGINRTILGGYRPGHGQRNSWI
jgi:hypothetical protein